MSAPYYDGPLHMMEKIGGSFVRALVDLYYRADSNNKARVRAAFPEYFERYERQFREWRDRQASITESEGGEL
jgi:hypothetical protein